MIGNHGVALHEHLDLNVGEFVWEFAAGRGEQLAIFAPTLFATKDVETIVPRRREADQVWSNTMQRPLSHSAKLGYDYARYHPERKADFTSMCRSLFICSFFAVVVPRGISDSAAVSVMEATDNAGPELRRQSLSSQRFGPVLAVTVLPCEWVYVISVLSASDDPIGFFLSRRQGMVDQLLSLVIDDRDRFICERW